MRTFAVSYLLAILAIVTIVLAIPPPIPSTNSLIPRLTAFRRRATLPGDDPFYTAPDNLTSYSPGDIISSRTVDLNLTDGTEAWQLFYRTESVNGTALAMVTTIFKPKNAKGTEVLAYNIPEDSVSPQCAPSYTFETGAATSDIMLQIFITNGWIVSVADYEGPDSAYSAGRLEGKGVLDGLKASLNFKDTLGLTDDVKTASFGYSGGAIANSWAAALQPTYAPDLPIVGFAHGGTPANLTGTLDYIDGTFAAGLGIGGIVGLSRAYSALQTLLDKIATDYAKNQIQTVYEKSCTSEEVLAGAFEKVQSDKWTSAGDRLLYLPEVVNITNDNILGRDLNEIPQAPIYLFHAKFDEIIPIANVETMVSVYCDNNIPSLTYQRDVGPAEHVSMAILGFPNAVAWLRDRFEGVQPNKGCSISDTVLPILDPSALGEVFRTLLQALLNLLTNDVGTQDEIYKDRIISQAHNGTRAAF